MDLTYEDSKGTSSTMRKQTKLLPLEKRPKQHNRSISSPFSVDVNQQSSISTNRNIPILPTPDPMPGDCDVKSFINRYTTLYDGDASFLAGPTQRTQKALQKVKTLLALEREKGGVLSVDADIPSTITSHAPGYLLSKEEDVIVGLQAEEPLKRTCKPHGGFGVVKKALESYGYEPGEKLKVFADEVTTHNDLTFSIYTDKVRPFLVSCI